VGKHRRCILLETGTMAGSGRGRPAEREYMMARASGERLLSRRSFIRRESENEKHSRFNSVDRTLDTSGGRRKKLVIGKMDPEVWKKELRA